MNYDYFIANLKTYNKNLNELKRLEEALDILEYEATGVKGLDPSKIRTSGSELAKNLKRLDLIDKIEKIKNEIAITKEMLKTTKFYLDRQSVPYIDILNDLFVKGEKQEKIATKYGYLNSISMLRDLKRSVKL